MGAFGRIDVPLIVATVLREELALRGLSSQYVLYTDTDVMFARDWPQHRDLFKCADCHRNWPSKKCCRVPVQDHEPEIFLARHFSVSTLCIDIFFFLLTPSIEGLVSLRYVWSRSMSLFWKCH